jgi:predicted CxxxxCH...CXXCH cytochrome family protein
MDLVALLGIVTLVLATGFGCGDDPHSASDDAGLGDVSGSDAGSDTGNGDATLDAGDEDVGGEDAGRDGDAGGDADDDAESVGYGEIWQALDDAHTCSNGYCHGGAPNIIGYDALVNQASDCDGSPRVVPGDPEGSLLWRKIAPEIAAEDVCGDKMAPNDPVDQELVDQVYEWIAAGAQR